MGIPPTKSTVSVAEYLETEKTRTVRHEFIGGHIHAMAGASDRHHRIRANSFKMLDNAVQFGECEAFITDMKLKVDEETVYYPDVFVACDGNPESPYYRVKPRLIIEVVSPSTRQIDRREKFKVYREIESLQEYVIVEQDKMQVEIHSRQPNGTWLTSFFTDTEREYDMEFQSVNLLTSI